MNDSAARPTGPDAHEPAAALVFDDPQGRASHDDTDEGWGDRPSSSGGGAADLARFLDEKPPHHL
jgi:hypothetical protein